MKIRAGTAEDLPFVQQMLFEAFFWQPGQPRPDAQEFLSQPEIEKLLANWGRPGDAAFIAEKGDTHVGAAWYRLGTDEDHSYGYVDSETPELGISVHADHRSGGVGRALMLALIAAARAAGFPALSLSVVPENFARQLYESLGFVKVGESGTSWTLLLKL